jgi:predicted transcriptional regulator
MTKMDIDDVENQNRSSIQIYIKENPGCRPCDIQKTFNLSYSTVIYHLSVLISSGHIRKIFEQKGMKRLYPNDGKGYYQNLNIKEQKILKIISERGISDRKDIQNILGYSQPVLSRYLRKLEMEHLIEKIEKEDSRLKHYRLVRD